MNSCERIPATNEEVVRAQTTSNVRVDTKPTRRGNVHPRLCYLAEVTRRGTGRSRHLGLAEVLSISLLAGFVVIAIDLAMVWEIVHGAKRIRLSI